jgi:HlyD family secretion protein
MTGFVGYIIYLALQSSRNNVYTTVHAEFRDIERKLIIPGTIQPYKEIDIKSTISGVLEHLFVQIGDEVVSGQSLAQIQYVKEPLEYKRLLRDLEITKTRYDNAKKMFGRTLELYKKNIIATEEFESEQSNVLIMQSEYHAIVAELNILRGKYDQKDISNIITATNDGTILELPVKEGGSVMARGTLSEGSTIAKMADLHSLIFKGNVLESDILKLKLGMEVSFYMIADKEMKLPGILTVIAPKGMVQNGVSRFEITAEIHIPEEYRSDIKAGYTVNAEIVLEKKQRVLSLEEKYFQFNYDSIYVEVKNEKGKYTKQFIKTGISDGIYTEITEGIDSTNIIKVIE